MIRAHQIRLHPTAEQARYFARAAGTARFVFNWGLEHWIKGYQAGQQPTALKLKKAFNRIKAEQSARAGVPAKPMPENERCGYALG
jgi:putative transposase